ncbi:MAG TPA: hypothetical protein VGY99_26585 [Candidatus Binataceae bacterium]|jgi:hypothetical protein|nr:hypothetical protein [Candidatus Binataceae bacterium]
MKNEAIRKLTIAVYERAFDRAVAGAAAGLAVEDVRVAGLVDLDEFVKVACKNLWRERKGKEPLPYPAPVTGSESDSVTPEPGAPGPNEPVKVAAVKPARKSAKKAPARKRAAA